MTRLAPRQSASVSTATAVKPGALAKLRHAYLRPFMSEIRTPDLSGHEHNYDDVRCAEFGLWPGARREHIPKWICDRRATQPQAKFGATLRAAVLFRPDVVARSSQTPEGYTRRSRLVWPKNPSPRTSS